MVSFSWLVSFVWRFCPYFSLLSVLPTCYSCSVHWFPTIKGSCLRGCYSSPTHPLSPSRMDFPHLLFYFFLMLLLLYNTASFGYTLTANDERKAERCLDAINVACVLASPAHPLQSYAFHAHLRAHTMTSFQRLMAFKHHHHPSTELIMLERTIISGFLFSPHSPHFLTKSLLPGRIIRLFLSDLPLCKVNNQNTWKQTHL
jgi:hypothetical protein